MDNSRLRDLQLCELNILKSFINICEKHNLKYFAGGGTLLGAIRHKGFIPWDDDIDIYMLRDDYEKFLKLSSELPSNLELYTFDTKKDYISYQAVIMDKKYKVKLNHTKNGIYRNAWIDIWPLDTMPSNRIKFMFRKYRILYRRLRYQMSVFDTMVDLNKKRPFHEKVLIFMVSKLKIGKKSNSLKMLRKLDKVLKEKPKKPKYYLNGMSVYKFKNMMPCEVYGTGNLYDFEDIKILGPVEYDYFLKRLYGDYMTPPSDVDKNRHNLEFCDGSDNNEKV